MMAAAAAFFDVDGTLLDRHIVHQYIFFRRDMMAPILRPLWTTAFYVMKGPYYKILDKISRTRLNISFYRNYAGLSTTEVRARVQDCFQNVMRPNLFEQATECIAKHRQAGRRIVFVTGSIDFIVAPLAEHLGAEQVLAPGLLERHGRFTGELDGPPVGEREKARRVREYADSTGVDLAASFAYGDSIADLPMLREVGHPNAVNPDRALAGAARRFGWPLHHWAVRNGSATTR